MEMDGLGSEDHNHRGNLLGDIENFYILYFVFIKI